MNVSSIGNPAAYFISESRQPREDQKALIKAVGAVNAAELFGQENEVTYVVDRAAQIAVVRVINKQTGEVVDQIPTEQLLKLAEESNGR